MGKSTQPSPHNQEDAIVDHHTLSPQQLRFRLNGAEAGTVMMTAMAGLARRSFAENPAPRVWQMMINPSSLALNGFSFPVSCLVSVYLVLLAFLLLALPGVVVAEEGHRVGEGPSSQPWHSGIHTISHSGFTRRFRLHLPDASANPESRPLIFAFHGWGGDEHEFLGSLEVQRALAGKNYIVIAPVGLGPEEAGEYRSSWSFRGSATGFDGDGLNPSVEGDTALICDPASTPDYTYPSCGRQGAKHCGWTHCLADDIDFVVALLQAAKRHLTFDAHRVFAVGGSNGGMLIWDLAVNPKSAPHFRAFASLIGLPHRGYDQAPSQDLAKPMLLITGGRDTAVPPGPWGDHQFTTTQNGESYFYTSASAITASWAAALGCDTSAPESMIDFGQEVLECRSWQRCQRSIDGPVILDCRASQMGHDYQLALTWPLILQFFEQFR
jgi:poly(3-hydroxybutyrate) depolymerase